MSAVMVIFCSSEDDPRNHRINTNNFGFAQKSKYHQRQLVDASDPAYQEANEGMTEYHQRQLVD
ncbi:MAG: hypothetical protein ND866_13845, partial [Pyrinomonadaceae bacterium]|nr:hypothetical protein [Pyrinomonadaceae bacterium]